MRLRSLTMETMISNKALRGNLWRLARGRAEDKDLPFDLTPEDIMVPLYCPVLGLELCPGPGVSHDASPTLDRIAPEKGYVVGNVIVISNRANRLKSDASLDELRRIASFYVQLID